MDDLLREAIADAKAVRETALENAKIALEEAFTPRLQSMLSKKIATEMEDSEIEDDHEMEDDHDMEDGHEMGHEESEIEDDHDMEDGEERNESEIEDGEEIEDSEQEERNESEVEDDHDVEDGEERNEEEEMEDEDDLDLNSVLAELEADLNEEDEEEDKVDESEKSDKDEEDKVDESEKSDKDEEDKVDENDVSSDIGKADNKVNPEANDSTKSGAQGPEGEGSDKESGKELGDHEVVDDLVESEDLDLDEVLKALTEEEDAEDEADKVEELQAELKETREVVQFMRDKLNEVNLLNAKLLFSNKLFRAYGLNNDQKLKVVETFDRTKNLREVKLVYATLAESFKKPSKPLSESVSKGSSSKPVASTKPAKQEVLSEGAEMKARFKKLANIL
jgi:hypothetical protein